MFDEPEGGIADQQADLFEAFASMTLAFARLAAATGQRDDIIKRLDYCLGQGWMFRTQFSIGGAGPLGCNFVAVSPGGTVVEILSLDAPPSPRPFRIDDALGQHPMV